MCSIGGWVHAALPLSFDGTPSLARCRDFKLQYILESRHPRWAVPSRLSPLLCCLLLPFTEEGELTNEGGGGLCVIHPAAPWRKQMDQAVKGIG